MNWRMIKKKRVLVVEDSISSRRYLCKKLQDAGFDTFEAVNGRDAYEKLKKEDFDFLILDLLMPEMTGTELLEKMKEEKIKTPVMVVSADIQQQVKDECFALGAVDFINKPINIDELINKLNECLNS